MLFFIRNIRVCVPYYCRPWRLQQSLSRALPPPNYDPVSYSLFVTFTQ